MKERDLSPQQMFIDMAREHKPQCAFSGASLTEFEAWKADATPRVLATLGDSPASVPTNPEMTAAWEHNGLLKQRWLIDVAPHSSAVFQVNRPLGLTADEKRPTRFCWHGHGHGQFGKEPVSRPACLGRKQVVRVLLPPPRHPG